MGVFGCKKKPKPLPLRAAAATTACLDELRILKNQFLSLVSKIS
jgi:hypothetical protein